MGFAGTLLDPSLLPTATIASISWRNTAARVFFPDRLNPRTSATIRALSSANEDSTTSSSSDSGPPQDGSSFSEDHRALDGTAGNKSSRKHKRPFKEKLPKGLRRYETTAILRPDITQDERLAWTQRYEEAIIAGGALSVEFSNRGIMPLTYNIQKKDMGGFSKTYLDGVYMQISYITKPQSQLDLQKKFNADEDIIRSITLLMVQHINVSGC